MKITNIFFSIQGSGRNIGVPAVFVRLTGCNKRCSFCDTEYSFKGGKKMSILKVLHKVASFNCRHVVITGGEPLLQQDELIDLMEKLLSTESLFYYFEIETNGTIPPKKRLAELTDLFTVSPKFEDFEYAPIFSSIEKLAERPEVIFKFVIDKKEDMKDVLQFVRQYNREGREVFLMPCSKTAEEHNSRLKLVIDCAKQFGFRATPRLHILAYGGKKRGV